MSFETATPYIASYVLLRKDGKLCMVRRKNTGWMDGFYGLPAGKVEKNEPFALAAAREALEEVGVKVKPQKLEIVLTAHRKAEHEWVDVFFEARDWQGKPTNMEPEVHDEVAWFNIHNLPENTIPAIKFYVKQILEGNRYCEFGWEE